MKGNDMTKHDIDVAHMCRYILRGFKFEFTGLREWKGQMLKCYRIRNDWFGGRGPFYVKAQCEE